MALEQKLNRGTFEIKTVLALLKKYRYALWVAALGFILLMLPMKEEQTVSAPAETIPQQTESSEDMERRLETVLDRHGVFYEKTEVWIDTERLYEALYSTEVLRTD